MLIATVGLGECFLINAASFVAVVVSLVTMDRSALRPTPPMRRARPDSCARGCAMPPRMPEIAVPLLMMAVIGTLAYEFQVSLPVMASHALHSGRRGLRLHDRGDGDGGDLRRPRRRGARPHRPAAGDHRRARRSRSMLVAAALAPDMAVELVALALVGAASVSFMSIGNSTIQLAADPAMRGRVMALWFVALQGSTPIGGPVVGAIIALAGARTGLGVGALACLRRGGARGRRPAAAAAAHRRARDTVVAEAAPAVAVHPERPSWRCRAPPLTAPGSERHNRSVAIERGDRASPVAALLAALRGFACTTPRR